MTWILIMTIVYAGDAAHIDHIEGFGSRDSCMKAGQLWQDTANGLSEMARARATCIRKE